MPDDSNERRRGTTATRRAILEAAGAGSAVGAMATLFSTGAAATDAEPDPASGDDDLFAVERTGEAAFPQSVASGGPTPAGAIVWTRVDEAAYEAGADVGLQVTPAPDRSTPNDAADFSTADTEHFRVPAAALSPDDDYTLNVDLDGELDADRFYFYRFVYDGDASPVGRLRTLPEPDADPDRLTLACVSCNNYLDGYYGAFGHVAEEDADYLLHLGDLIYEYAGGGNVQGRGIQLPSGNGVAHTLADFRHLHQVYRSDEFFAEALSRHTLVMTWDDHEIVNNRWWNYEESYPNTASHPYGDDPERMRRLYVEGIKALVEYLPFRVDYDPDADDLHDRFRLYRRFRFGRLADVLMTDERLYRSPPPEDAFGQRDTATPPSRKVDDPDRTMLGTDQREWFLDGVTNSPATWKVWGNSVLNAALKATNLGEGGSFYVNYDAWDGYEYERQLVMGELDREARSREGALNLVTLTGDMHAYVAGYLKTDYRELEQQAPFPGAEASRVGVEFMSTSVSSDNLAAQTPTPPELEEDAVEAAVESQNPHVEWFNWSRHGYTTVEFTDDEAIYTAYEVDRTVDSADTPKRLLRSYRVPEGEVEIQELVGSPTDVTSLLSGAADGGLTDTEGGPPDVPDADATPTTEGERR
ncbi:alkaline phosphatase D family protein [Natronomonas marina]|uniref:alkaline phosphatase D family protein n=1 Tax=Natronomonas marina TaxID=2961939 RepID=UPI0020C99508|nr:alkaline phosphatase D family protein [Natronomonas marina]